VSSPKFQLSSPTNSFTSLPHNRLYGCDRVILLILPLTFLSYHQAHWSLISSSSIVQTIELSTLTPLFWTEWDLVSIIQCWHNIICSCCCNISKFAKVPTSFTCYYTIVCTVVTVSSFPWLFWAWWSVLSRSFIINLFEFNSLYYQAHINYTLLSSFHVPQSSKVAPSMDSCLFGWASSACAST